MNIIRKSHSKNLPSKKSHQHFFTTGNQRLHAEVTRVLVNSTQKRKKKQKKCNKKVLMKLARCLDKDLSRT